MIMNILFSPKASSFTTRHVDDDNDNGWIFCETEKKYDRSFDIFYGLFVVAAKLSSKIKRGYLCALENKACSPSLAEHIIKI